MAEAKSIVGYIERVVVPEEEGKNPRWLIGTKWFWGTKNTAGEMTSGLYKESDLVEVTYFENPGKDGGVFNNIVGVKHATEEDKARAEQTKLEAPPPTEHRTTHVPEQYITTIQGRKVVTSMGLVKLAHDNGLKSIIVLKSEYDAEKGTAFAHVQVELKNGKFEATAGANKNNLKQHMASYYVELADTRAMNRALRRGLNVDMVSAEELFEDDTNKEESHYG